MGKTVRMSDTLPRIAVYYRVSTNDQSVDSQRAEVRAYLARRWPLPDASPPGTWRGVREYEEKASGSGKKKRPVYEEVRLAARRREIQVIVVARLDRFGRNLYELVGTLEELGRLGVTFVSVAEGHDTGTPAGRALFQVAAVFAEYEKALNNERTHAGIRAAKEQGVRFGRPPTVAARLTDAVVLAAVQQHGSGAKAARALGVSSWSVQRVLRRIKDGEERATQVRSPREETPSQEAS